MSDYWIKKRDFPWFIGMRTFWAFPLMISVVVRARIGVCERFEMNDEVLFKENEHVALLAEIAERDESGDF